MNFIQFFGGDVMATHPGDSPEQRDAERFLIEGLSKRLGAVLAKKRLEEAKGEWLEIDGWCESPSIVVEAWAHLGKPKSAQKNKVLADAFKLLYVSKVLGGNTRRILGFADPLAAAHFRGRSWMAKALASQGIEIEIVSLPQASKESVLAAQSRQYR